MAATAPVAARARSNSPHRRLQLRVASQNDQPSATGRVQPPAKRRPCAACDAAHAAAACARPGSRAVDQPSQPDPAGARGAAGTSEKDAFSLLWLYSHWNAWANLLLLGQPNTHGPTCFFWANLTPFSLQALAARNMEMQALKARMRMASSDRPTYRRSVVAGTGPGPPGVVNALSVSHSRSLFYALFCMALLYARAGRLTSQNGGFRPGQ